MLTSRRIWRDRKETFRRYYNWSRFPLLDLTFGLIALFLNPYRTCRKFLQKKGAADIHAYGETPYSTYERIAAECNIGPHDTWVEMGAGRGKGCFWMAQFIRCKVIGIEWIPSFVYQAKAIQALFRVKNISFELGDMEKADLTSATILYLYGHWPALSIPPGVKVLTISEPLENLPVLKAFWVRYPWGRTRAFLQKSI